MSSNQENRKLVIMKYLQHLAVLLYVLTASKTFGCNIHILRRGNTLIRIEIISVKHLCLDIDKTI